MPPLKLFPPAIYHEKVHKRVPTRIKCGRLCNGEKVQTPGKSALSIRVMTSNYRSAAAPTARARKMKWDVIRDKGGNCMQ